MAQQQHNSAPPLIGVTPDIHPVEGSTSGAFRVMVASTYMNAISRAGGVPVVLAPDPGLIRHYVERLDGVLFTGGNDIDTRAMGVPLHPEATIMDPRRQTFELQLLQALDASRVPTLGVCLGMQMMGLHRAGVHAIIQHLPDTVPTANQHTSAQGDGLHPIGPTPDWSRSPLATLTPTGAVASHHHQGVDRAAAESAGLRTLATAFDGVLEAFDDPSRTFYVGVQWHPERTHDQDLGDGVVRRLVDAARNPRP